jgi:AhpD family alkylhydroperoxidase
MSRSTKSIVNWAYNQNLNNMNNRLNPWEKGQAALKTLFSMSGYLKKSKIDASLRELIEFRLSQINGCAYCLDMHYKDARAHGETEQRLYGLSVWHEAPYYTDRERAALAWAEAVNTCDVSDAVYAEVLKQFSEEELVDLTLVVASINAWNRVNIAFPQNIGTYQVGQFG